MAVFKLLFTSEVGLFALGVTVCAVAGALYLHGRLRKLMNDKPGKEGWH
jgi:hypothetical protein